MLGNFLPIQNIQANYILGLIEKMWFVFPILGTQAIFNHAGEKKSLRQMFFSGHNIHLSESLLKDNLTKADDQGVYYSNVGYNLLALIIENVSGLSYDKYLRNHIFDKAGMTNTFSGSAQDYGIYHLIHQHNAMAEPKVYKIQFNTRKNHGQAYRVSIDPTKKNNRKKL